MIKSVNAIIDLQFGSTGKGLLAGFLARKNRPDTIVTAWAANAGHTFIDSTGEKHVHTMLANGVVSPRCAQVLLGPGSIIDPVNLRAEIDARYRYVDDVEIRIHPNAAIITQAHRDEEARTMTAIGSTKKGCGAAAIQRIARQPGQVNTAWGTYEGTPQAHPLLRETGLDELVLPTPQAYFERLSHASVVQIEGAQGYSLSMYHGFYPYTTSRDVSTHQLFADCGLPFRLGRAAMVTGTARAFPIRVANRYDADGKQVGWSGPCYADQTELDWQRDLGREPELTTVTKLPRRIFTMSDAQLVEAATVCGIDELFLNFVNYCPTANEAYDLVVRTVLKLARTCAYVGYVGMGPSVDDIFDFNNYMGSAEEEGAGFKELREFIAGYYASGAARA